MGCKTEIGDLMMEVKITSVDYLQGTLLLTWFNFNPSMDK